MSALWHRLVVGVLAALLALPAHAAREDFLGTWVATFDVGASSIMAKLEDNTFRRTVEAWVIEGEYIRAFGPELVFRITSIDGLVLKAQQDTTRDLLLRQVTNAVRPVTPTSLTIEANPGARRLRITEDRGPVSRVLNAVPVGAGAVAAPPPPQACPPVAQSSGELNRLRTELNQCTARLQAQASPPAVAPPPPRPVPAPAPVPAPPACPAVAGGERAIQIEGAAPTADAGRVRLTLPPNPGRSVTIRGRSGFAAGLAAIDAGGQEGAIASCGQFSVVVRLAAGFNSVTITATGPQGRSGRVVVELAASQ